MENTMFKRFVITSITAAALATIAGGVLALDVAPDELMRKNVTEILATIKADPALQQGDTKKMEKLADEKVIPFFNFNKMTQLAVGRGWKEATDAQKTALTNEFRTLLVRTYSAQMAQFRNQTIDVKPLKGATAADTEVTVKTLINQPGGSGIPIDYSMEKGKDGWKVHDVLIDGVSLVTNYRSSFGKEIQTTGIDGLIKVLADRNAKNVAKK
jgi:phospholipid transport system substrate-binding protein